MLVHHAKVNPRAPFFPDFMGRTSQTTDLRLEKENMASKITHSPKIAGPIKTIKTTMLQTCHEHLWLPRSWSCLVRDGPAGACSQSWRRSIPELPRGFGRSRRIPAKDWDWKLGTSWHILAHLDTIRYDKHLAANCCNSLAAIYWDNRCCPAVALSVHFKAFQGKRDSWHQGKKVRILGLHGEEHQKYNGKNGAIMAFDPTTGRYSVQLSMQSISTSDLQVFDVGLIRMRAPTSAPQQPEWPSQYSHNPRTIIVRS